ncbi:hypothetical protein ACF049_00460 [Cellulosimicrobium funkei]|uniref:hypothetical protein n=1 Tax=Cellulosimicrobium funkei TaxID=264251 RepID=UPI0036FBB763
MATKTTNRKTVTTTPASANVPEPSAAYVAARERRESAEVHLSDVGARLSRASADRTKVLARRDAGDLDLTALEILAAEAEAERLEAAQRAARAALADAQRAEVPFAVQHAADVAAAIASDSTLNDVRDAVADDVVKAALPVLTAALANVDALASARADVLTTVAGALKTSGIDDYRHNHVMYRNVSERLERDRQRLQWAKGPGARPGELDALHASIASAEDSLAELAPYAQPLADGATLDARGRVVVDKRAYPVPTSAGQRRAIVDAVAERLAVALGI